MVYVEPSQIGCWPIITSWMRHVKENFPGLVNHYGMIFSLLEWLCDPCVDFVKRHCRDIVPTAPINLAQSLLKMYECLLDEFRIAPGSRASQRVSKIGGISLLTPPTGDDINTWVQCLFFMSLVWSIGATIDSDGREKFNLFFRRYVADTCFAVDDIVLWNSFYNLEHYCCTLQTGCSVLRVSYKKFGVVYHIASSPENNDQCPLT